MGVPWLRILPVMIAVRQQDYDLGPLDVIKVARMAVGDSGRCDQLLRRRL